ELNAPAKSVLATIYNGPINTVDYEYQAVILTQLPTLENGDAQISRIKVEPRTEIVDANGDVVRLEKGVKVKPAGCRSDDCVIAFDGTDAIEMDQMIVTF